MKKIFLATLIISSLINAEGMPDTYKLSLGTYLTGDFNSATQIGNNNGVSVDLDLQDIFNMDTDLASLYIDGYYRFNPRHRIEVGYKSTKSSGQSNTAFTVGGNIIQDINITAGVNAHYNLAVSKLMYTYSFFHQDNMEVGISAGIYYAQFDLGFGAKVEKIGGDFAFKVAQGLPVVGARMDYTINPQWHVLYAFDIFALGGDLNVESETSDNVLKKFDGYMSDFTLSTEYRLYENFALGGSFNYAAQDFSIVLENAVQEDYKLGITNSIIGFAIYGTLFF